MILSILRSIGSVIAGLALAFAVLVAAEAYSEFAYPLPTGYDPKDILEVCKAHVAKYPTDVLAVCTAIWAVAPLADQRAPSGFDIFRRQQRIRLDRPHLIPANEAVTPHARLERDALRRDRNRRSRAGRHWPYADSCRSRRARRRRRRPAGEAVRDRERLRSARG